jgi:hypothetical protein
MRTIRLDDFSLREDGVEIPWPEGARLRLDDFTFVDKDHKPIGNEPPPEPSLDTTNRTSARPE